MKRVLKPNAAVAAEDEVDTVVGAAAAVVDVAVAAGAAVTVEIAVTAVIAAIAGKQTSPV